MTHWQSGAFSSDLNSCIMNRRISPSYCPVLLYAPPSMRRACAFRSALGRIERHAGEELFWSICVGNSSKTSTIPTLLGGEMLNRPPNRSISAFRGLHAGNVLWVREQRLVRDQPHARVLSFPRPRTKSLVDAPPCCRTCRSSRAPLPGGRLPVDGIDHCPSPHSAHCRSARTASPLFPVR